ncbi:helix-turn-helix domain-containing protein [Pseudomonas sp. S5D5]|uniref:helix-turn-helix domain-containing protein n=1 Tax=Pseudomonas sp. S5D5 TaxID=2083056 RepID=UPI000D10CADD|nr:helix-turn-helix domain-containing protein [Pseudomonas sp. S5D5]
MISILQNEVERLRPASNELAAQVDQYLAAGGKIEEGPASGYIPKPITYSNQMPPAPKPFVRRRVEAAPLPYAPLDVRAEKRKAQAERVKTMASTMTQTEVSAATGMTPRTLRELAKDFGFSFKRASHGGHYGEKWKAETKVRDANYAERIKAFKELGISRRMVCGKLAISNRTLERILEEHGIDYPKARQGKTSCAA